MPLEIVELNNRIWDLMRSITYNIEYIFRPTCERFDLTMMQMRILLEVWRNGLHTVGSLSRQMSIAGGNTSSICKRLEKEGFLTRIRDRQDERVVHLKLSGKGEEIILLMRNELRDKYTKQLGRLDENEVNDLIEALSKLDKTLICLNESTEDKDALKG